MSGLLKFITCGSVDDGKSTLIGHILYDSKLLYADQEKALLLDSKVGSRGGEIDYSLLLDGLMAEREQGITIDVAYRYFNTDRRSFIVADTPGHEEYTRNMAVGASFAQLAVVMVDATGGVLVQTRRHARICSIMGIRYFVFAVNKMDLVNYAEDRFNQIAKDIEELSRNLGLQNVKIIPVSATEGDNVTKESDHMPWYTGGTLLSYLEEVDVSDKELRNNFYMPVQRVSRPDYDFRGFQGQIESGSVSVGQKILVLPGNEQANVKQILSAGKDVTEAGMGQAVSICLDREVDVSRGSVLTDKELPVTDHITATLLWMDDETLTPGREYLVRLGTKKIPGIVKRIDYRIDVNTGEHTGASTLSKNEIAVCELELSQKIVADTFRNNHTLGELILIDRVSHMTSACGVAEKVTAENEKTTFERDGIRIGGYLFEELYYHLANAYMERAEKKTPVFHVGDEVPLVGKSFEYPQDFDVVSVDADAAVNVRGGRVTAILRLADFSFAGLPIVDERGFALKVSDEQQWEEFYREAKNTGGSKTTAEKRADFQNRYFEFGKYRKIWCV